MDAVIAAAADALAHGDPLAALKRVALRDDPPGLALRGIAMAQLGDLGRAKVLLRTAARAFARRDPVAHARCIVALAEIALAGRDLQWPGRMLAGAHAELERAGDQRNAAQARVLAIRHLVLLGRLEEAQAALGAAAAATLPAGARASHQLLAAAIAMRRFRATEARQALQRAGAAAAESGIRALMAEVDTARGVLDSPNMLALEAGNQRSLTLADVEALLPSGAFVVDACRSLVQRGSVQLALARRPVLFGLVRALAVAWPGDASRGDLLAHAFGAQFTDESHRARLRVEIGRLRRALGPLAEVRATPRGFILAPGPNSRTARAPRRGTRVVVLLPPVAHRHAALLALLADGEAWSSSAIALALGAGQRTVQRSLDELFAAEKVQALGRARARRWVLPPGPGFATTLLLPGPLPGV